MMDIKEYEEKLSRFAGELGSALRRNYVSEQACWVLAEYIGKIEKKYKDKEEKLVRRAREKARENIENREGVDS